MPIVPLVASCLCGIGLARGDAPATAPSPPLPKEVVAAEETQPAAFEPAAASPVAGPLPLAGPTAAPLGGPAPARPLGDWTVLAAIGAAFALLAALRLRPLRRARQLPPDVFELLGEASLGGPQAVRVVRFGPRTLLVAVSATGCQTLAEIDDPQATERIAAACLGERPAARVAARPAPPRVSGVGLVLLGLALGGSTAPAADDAASAANAPAAVAVTAVVPVTPEAPEPPATPAAVAVTPDSGDPPPSGWNPASLLQGRSLTAVLPSALLFGVATLAPAVLLMTTCFVRMSVVLGFVRQGLGAAQVPGNQVVASLAIFLSALVMWPVWTKAWNDGVAPYQAGSLTAPEAFERGSLPIRRWMAAQIEQAGNRDTMLLFLARHPAGPRQAATYDDVPLEALLPAFLVSELEVAFAIGFRLLLPFLVLDILVAALAAATGLAMLPPTLVSLPLKLLVFVAADGWTLVVRGLLDGFATS